MSIITHIGTVEERLASLLLVPFDTDDKVLWQAP